MMEAFLALLEEELVDLKEISYKGYTKSESEIISLFYFKFQNTPLLARMDAVMDYFKDEFVTLRGRELSEEEEEYLKEKAGRCIWNVIFIIFITAFWSLQVMKSYQICI